MSRNDYNTQKKTHRTSKGKVYRDVNGNPIAIVDFFRMQATRARELRIKKQEDANKSSCRKRFTPGKI